MINLSGKDVKLDSSEFFNANLNYSNSNIQSENFLSVLSYNLQISSFFTVFYEERFLKKFNISLRQILEYLFNEKKPFNIIVYYENDTGLDKLIDDFIASFTNHYKIDVNFLKSNLTKKILSSSEKFYDIFENENFKTNQKLYKHIIFQNNNPKQTKHWIASSNFKNVLVELKEFYKDHYEGSFNSFIERSICTKQFFNKYSYDYQFYNNQYKNSSSYKNFDLVINERVKKESFIKYKLKLVSN